MGLDEKQLALVNGWKDQAATASSPYFQFMSLWIAFNACCYALYSEGANKDRADLNVYKPGSSSEHSFQASVRLPPNAVHVESPQLRLKMKIRQNVYTEDHIYSQFWKQSQNDYAEELRLNRDFAGVVEQFRKSLAKSNGYYVINLSKPLSINLDDLSEKEIEGKQGILKSFHDQGSLRLLVDALYQVRCNIFHGNKVPGEPNDDRIVIAATPVLEEILAIALTSVQSPHS